MRVDDRFKFGCGDVIREKGGRHCARVQAIVFDKVLVKWLDTGWRSEFWASEIELAPEENWE